MLSKVKGVHGKMKSDKKKMDYMYVQLQAFELFPLALAEKLTSAGPIVSEPPTVLVGN